MILLGFSYDGGKLKVSTKSAKIKKVCAIVTTVAVVISAFLFLCILYNSNLKFREPNFGAVDQ